MKHIFTIAALFCAVNFYAQNKVAQKIEALNQSQVAFKRFSPLTVNNNAVRTGGDKVVKNAVYSTADNTVINAIAASGYEAIELSVPYNNTVITVQLYKTDITAEGFHVDTDRAKSIAYQEGVHYRGIIKGDTKSLVSFNFFENDMNGIISGKQYNDLVVGKLHRAGNVTDYITYSDVNLTIPNNFTCATAEPEAVKEKSARRDSQNGLTDNCVTMYFELDNDIFMANGGSTAVTTNWITSMFNNIQTLFANDGISTALKSVYIWTSQDPYFGSSSEDYLMGFVGNTPSFDGDLGQLLTIENAGLGGLAWLDGLCADVNYSYVDVELFFDEVPNFSWNVEATTHEFGHQMGSPHTHACFWNGNGTPIDACGIYAGYGEGCDSDILPWEQQGTIMSYCHLLDIGINLANGFGIQPSELIMSRVNDSWCLGTDCSSGGSGCSNLITNVTVVNTGNTTAGITWADDTANGPWQVSAATFNGTFTNWQTANNTSFTFNNLNPNTYYKFAIRPVCAEGTAQFVEIMGDTSADYCSGTFSFTDTGGVNGSYIDNQEVVKTFRPSAGSKIKVTFTQFDVEQGYDYMYVFNGPDFNSPSLGQFTGSSIPQSFESTAPDGSLTFVFVSDGSQTASGWNAQVSCTATASVSENGFTQFSYYPNPSGGIVNIKAAEDIKQVYIYNVAGQLLMVKNIDAPQAAIDISAFADGVYFFRAVSGNKENNFRIIKQ